LLIQGSVLPMHICFSWYNSVQSAEIQEIIRNNLQLRFINRIVYGVSLECNLAGIICPNIRLDYIPGTLYTLRNVVHAVLVSGYNLPISTLLIKTNIIIFPFFKVTFRKRITVKLLKDIPRCLTLVTWLSDRAT